MSELQVRVLNQCNPYIAFHGYDLDTPYFDAHRVTGFDFDYARVEIDHSNDVLAALPPSRLSATVLASLGIPDNRIASMMMVSEEAIKSSLKLAFESFAHEPVAGIATVRRSSLPRYLLRTGGYLPHKGYPASPLRLTNTETAVIEAVTAGHTNAKIAAKRGRTEDTIKSELARAARLNRDQDRRGRAVSTRTTLAMRALLSGQVAYREPELETLPSMEEQCAAFVDKLNALFATPGVYA